MTDVNRAPGQGAAERGVLPTELRGLWGDTAASRACNCFYIRAKPHSRSRFRAKPHRFRAKPHSRSLPSEAAQPVSLPEPGFQQKVTVCPPTPHCTITARFPQSPLPGQLCGICMSNWSVFSTTNPRLFSDPCWHVWARANTPKKTCLKDQAPGHREQLALRASGRPGREHGSIGQQRRCHPVPGSRRAASKLGEDHAAGGRHQGGQRSPGRRVRRSAGLRACEPRRLHLGAAGLPGGRKRPDRVALQSAVDTSSEVDSKIAAALLSGRQNALVSSICIL